MVSIQMAPCGVSRRIEKEKGLDHSQDNTYPKVIGRWLNALEAESSNIT